MNMNNNYIIYVNPSRKFMGQLLICERTRTRTSKQARAREAGTGTETKTAI
jgi:hypothetical protein